MLDMHSKRSDVAARAPRAWARAAVVGALAIGAALAVWWMTRPAEQAPAAARSAPQVELAPAPIALAPSPAPADTPRAPSAPPTAAQPAAAQSDPFKDFVRASKSGEIKPAPATAPPPARAEDPFKAFVEEAKKREAAVTKSPFGK